MLDLLETLYPHTPAHECPLSKQHVFVFDSLCVVGFPHRPPHGELWWEIDEGIDLQKLE